MSEGAATETAEKAKRQSMSWEDRIAIVDWLRALRSPLVFESKAAAAAHVAAEAKAEVTWDQLRYMFDQLPKLKLDEKFIFGDEQSVANISLFETRIIAIESALAQAINDIGGLKARIAELEGEASSPI